MRRLFWFGVLFALVSCTSQRAAYDQRIAREDFVFVMAWGSGWHGFTVLRLGGSGEASFLYGEEGDRRLIEFSVPPDAINALRAELDRVKYWSLGHRFSSGAYDGTQWFVKVRDGSKRHAVYLDNEFPPPIEDLSAFVKRTIVSRALERRYEGKAVDYDDWRENEPRHAKDTP